MNNLLGATTYLLRSHMHQDAFLNASKIWVGNQCVLHAQLGLNYTAAHALPEVKPDE